MATLDYEHLQNENLGAEKPFEKFRHLDDDFDCSLIALELDGVGSTSSICFLNSFSLFISSSFSLASED